MVNRTRSWLLFAVVISAWARPTLAQDCPERVGRWPDQGSLQVAVAGGHAYFGGDDSLRVADLSDPATPQVVGRLALQRGDVQGIAVSGDYAYIAAGDAGLRVIDVSTPSAPVEVGSFDSGSVGDVAVSGDFAFLAAGDAGLRVIDVSTPSAPVLVGFVDTGGFAGNIAFSGDYAYVTSSAGLWVIDVNAPSAPFLAGYVETGGIAWDVVVSGDHAYLAEGWLLGVGGLRVIDVSTPSAPVEVGFFEPPGAARSIAVSGDYAFLGSGGFHVIDVSTPSEPVEVGFVDTWVGDIAVRGDLAYVAKGGDGLRVIDVSTPSAPVLLGVVDTPAVDAKAVAVSGDYAYLAAGAAGLRVIDVSTPSASVEVGSFDSGWVNDISVSGDYAYVAAGDSGLQVIDVATPSAPALAGYLYTGGITRNVAVSGNYAYVTETHADPFLRDSLRVIDVSDPSSPVEVGVYEMLGEVYGVAVSGDYAYLAAGDAGLRVIDVSTPSEPAEIGFVVVDTGWVHDVAVSGDYAYVAAGEAGLRVVDVVTPSSPIEVGFFDMPGAAGGIAISGNFAYVTESYGEPNYEDVLRVIDVSIPPAPVELGFVATGIGGGGDVVVSGEYAYVTAASSGLRVIDVSTPSAPVEVRSVGASAVHAVAVAASGNFAYLAAGGTGLRVFDMSTPSSPMEVGSVDMGWVSDVALSGDYAYVAAGGSGLQVIDVSTPSAPVKLGYVYTGWAGDVAVSGGYACVAAGESGLRVVDVSTPASPIEVGFYETPRAALSVAVSGGYAYVAAGDAGLRVIDVSTPSAPVEVGHVDTGWANDVAVSADYAYVTAGNDGLRVIDVSTPSAPAEAGFIVVDANWVTDGVAVSGDHAYVSSSKSSMGNSAVLSVIDVSSPSAPVVVGLVDWGGGSDVAASGGLIYVVRGPEMKIYRECGGLVPPGVYESIIPAAAVAAGAEGAFFQTDIEINNTSREGAFVYFLWLPRGQDNSRPVSSGVFSLHSNLRSHQFHDALGSLFDLGPDSVGAIAMVANSRKVIGMSRIYTNSGGESAGTFGQSMPAVPFDDMIPANETRRIIFLSEDPDFRANLGCVNAVSSSITVGVSLFDALGTPLETIDLDLPPRSHKQINRIFGGYAPVNGYVDVSTATVDGRFYCYGSVLDNETSDPTTILPQVPSDRAVYLPAAAVAAGADGAFFQTDVDLNNTGDSAITYTFKWLPRGQDNSSADESDPFSLGAGMGVRLANVLPEVFGLEPDSMGALLIDASSEDLLAMSRTYNIPDTEVAGTFGQALPGIHMDMMIPAGGRKRIVFMREDDDFRANLGCVNGVDAEVTVHIDLFDADGDPLATKHMVLPPFSNKQLNRIFQDYAPVRGYVDVWTYTPNASVYCYGSILDNVTSDPTTILPQ